MNLDLSQPTEFPEQMLDGLARRQPYRALAVIAPGHGGNDAETAA